MARPPRPSRPRATLLVIRPPLAARRLRSMPTGAHKPRLRAEGAARRPASATRGLPPVGTVIVLDRHGALRCECTVDDAGVRCNWPALPVALGCGDGGSKRPRPGTTRSAEQSPSGHHQARAPGRRTSSSRSPAPSGALPTARRSGGEGRRRRRPRQAPRAAINSHAKTLLEMVGTAE